MATRRERRLNAEQRAIVNAAEYLRTRSGKADLLKSSIKTLDKGLNSSLRAFTIEVLAKTFGVTPHEVLNGKDKFIPIEKMPPLQKRMQKCGFHEGAKVPGSTIRKIDK